MPKNTKQAEKTVEKNDIIDEEVANEATSPTKVTTAKGVDSDEIVTDTNKASDKDNIEIVTPSVEDNIDNSDSKSQGNDEVEKNPLAEISEIKEEDKVEEKTKHSPRKAGYGWNDYGFNM